MTEIPWASPIPSPHPTRHPNQTPSAQHQRNQRSGQYDQARIAHLDGSMSDSFAPTSASPRAKKSGRGRNPNHANAQQPHYTTNANLSSARMKQHAHGLGAESGDSLTPETPLKIQDRAYAGAKFQDSPAASSLPTPKLFSRSAPRLSRGSFVLHEQTPGKDESSPEAQQTVSSNPPARATQQSPLDALFDADRAEKERSRVPSSVHSPEPGIRVPPATDPHMVRGNPQRCALFQQLDGEDSDPPGPQSLPNQPRFPLPARNCHSPSMARGRLSSMNEENERHTRSLKDMLFNAVNSASEETARSPRPPQSSHSDFEGVFGVPSPAGPSTPASGPIPDHQQDNYFLHYGNRNLSPFFDAMRNDPTARPTASPLRHPAFTNDASSFYAPHPANQMTYLDHPNHFSPQPRFNDHHAPPQPRFNDHHAPPQPRFNNHHAPPQPRFDDHYAPYGPTQHLTPPPSNASTDRPASTSQIGGSGDGSGGGRGQPGLSPPPSSGSGNRDIRSMEDDLRRMLNLNVLSN